MGESFEEHFIWTRNRNVDGWSSWLIHGRCNTRMDAEDYLKEYIPDWEAKNPEKTISAVALPVGVSPVANRELA